ncbi:MAG: hybrid sensor histidine kinase/response regulator, partial [Alphaproteobacteria bacterium]
MAQLMRAHDWQSTPLGNPQDWPSSLKAALRLLLTSRFEMWLGWGPDINFFYNDAYRPTLGIKHPHSLGQPTQVLWAEIWEDIKDRIAVVYERGEATWDRALLLLLERNGYPEETYHTFSYSPLIDDNGKVQGVFCAVSEETDRVISERRLASLQQLAAALTAANSRAGVLAATDIALVNNRHDLPFSLAYVFNNEGGADLVCGSGLEPGDVRAPNVISASDTLWSLDAVRNGQTAPIIIPCDGAPLPGGAWDKSPIRTATIPLVAQGGRAFGALVVGLNPYRPDDKDYLPFLTMLAGQITSALSSADAIEADRAERDRMRELFQQAPSFMCILSGPDHVFELVNDAYLQLVGHRDLIGASVRDALPEINGQGFFELLDAVRRDRKPFVGRNMQVQLQRTIDGPLDQRFLHLVYQPIIEDDGSVSGIFVDGYDVTDQKRAQDQLQQLNQTLELRVEERTDALSGALAQLQQEATEREQVEAALRQSQKIEALGKLTGG